MNSRTKNTTRNISIALIGQAISILVSLVSRDVFLDYLGEVYLGVNGLFTNILTMLSLAEMGFASAIIYSLYKPLAEGDKETVAKIMKFYKRIYTYVGLVVLVIGLTITPFLQHLIKNEESIEIFSTNQLRLYFLLFLANSVSSYFLAYKRTLIIADQKRYLSTITKYSFFLLLNILQVVVLIVTGNFILFLLLLIANTILENITISKIIDRLYPYLKEYKSVLSDEEKRPIYKNVKAMLFHKLGGVAVNGSTNLIISAFIGVIIVGIYSNYLLVIVALNGIFIQIFEATTASVGNLSVTSNKDDLEKMYYKMFFANGWIISFASVSLLILFNHFISLWLGSEYLFGMAIVLVIVLNFYINGMRRTTIVYKDSLGLFNPDKYKAIVEAILGIGLSIGFSYLWGTLGVLIGFTLATFSTTFIVEPYVLYKHGFNKLPFTHFKKYGTYFTITVLSYFITLFTVNKIFTVENWYTLIGKLFFVILIPNLIYIIVFNRTEEFKYFYNLFKKGIKVVKSKIFKRQVLEK